MLKANIFQSWNPPGEPDVDTKIDRIIWKNQGIDEIG
jgi:hypothetical protein